MLELFSEIRCYGFCLAIKRHGFSGKASDHDEIETALNVFDALMDQNLWNLPVSVSINTGVTKEEARNNIVQVLTLFYSC